jgi:hypothetical protein
MPGDRWIGWDLVMRIHIFSLTVWFQKERMAVNIMGHVLVPWCWRRMSWEWRSQDQQKVIRLWVVMRNWLGDP